jgi:hypothetical protein
MNTIHHDDEHRPAAGVDRGSMIFGLALKKP